MRIKPVRSQAQNIDNKLIPKKPKHQAHTTIKNNNYLPKIYFINISINGLLIYLFQIFCIS